MQIFVQLLKYGTICLWNKNYPYIFNKYIVESMDTEIYRGQLAYLLMHIYGIYASIWFSKTNRL